MSTTLYNSVNVTDNIEGELSDNIQHFVYLNTRARRNSNISGQTFETNRIGLKADSISITTSKTVPALPVPGVGAITGEAQTLALDMGMCTKSINITGVITEQFISKAYAKGIQGDAENKKVYMTASEIAQLIHSYVDSSVFQGNQNMNELVILFPSRVDHEFQYHQGTNERTTTDAGGTPTTFTPIENLPLVPFSYKVRNQDNRGSIYGTYPDDATTGETFTNFPKPIHSSQEPKGVEGFIRSFNCTLQGGQPFVQFSLDFEVAFVVG